MIDYKKLHEVACVAFRSKQPRPTEELIKIFMSQGFTLHDDVISLDRTGSNPPWQASAIADVEVTLQDKEIFVDESGLWDGLSLSYLFAYLPFDLVVSA